MTARFDQSACLRDQQHSSIWRLKLARWVPGFPRYRYTSTGERIDNITDWALSSLNQAFTGEALPSPEGSEGARSPRTRSSTTSMRALHDPVYREKYAHEPEARVPAHSVLRRFLALGGMGRAADGAAYRLREVAPWPLVRIDTPDEKARAAAWRRRRSSRPTRTPAASPRQRDAA